MNTKPIPIAAAAAPTPIPAFAPVDIPELLDGGETSSGGVGTEVLVYVSFVDGVKVGEGEREEVVWFDGGIMNECCWGRGDAATAVRVDIFELVEGSGLGVVMERTTVVGPVVVRVLVI
jgi:hypothetical protein